MDRRHLMDCMAAVPGSMVKGALSDMVRTDCESGVLETVAALNRAWTVDRAPERLAEFFHPRMVAISPSPRERIEGGRACVEGWSAFARSCRVTAWRTQGEKVELFDGGDFTVVTYYYEMSWETDKGETVETSGRDMLVLVREQGRRLVVADHFSPYPDC